MDNNLTVSETGHKTEQINIFINENSAEENLQFNPIKCKYLIIGRKKENVVKHTLEVDSWNVEYDKEDNLVETEGKKTAMIQVSEMNYPESASNVPNILDKQKKANGTRRNITNMIRDLQTYTIQNGIIYLNSLLRSSVLYAGETYYNLREV